MKKSSRKLEINTTTIKNLSGKDLKAVVGGDQLPGSNNTCRGAICKVQ